MDWPLITLADVLAARRALSPYLRPTPVLEPAELSEALGCALSLKCENLQPTRSFKVRGGINLVSTLSPDERARGVLAVSTGNHAQSVAYAARLFGVPATIYMPEGANPLKMEATRRLGARVVESGHDFDAAKEAAESFAARAGMRYIHSGNEPLLIAGVATAALEWLEVAPDLEILFVPLGGGSGVLGASIVAHAINPAIRVVGVQSTGAPAVYRSWKEGRRVETEIVHTFAEGLATRKPFEITLAWLPGLVDEVMLVTDDQLRAAIRMLFATTRQVAEGAGAAALAAAWQRREELAGRRVGLMLSGGNLTMDLVREILLEPDSAAR